MSIGVGTPVSWNGGAFLFAGIVICTHDSWNETFGDGYEMDQPDEGYVIVFNVMPFAENYDTVAISDCSVPVVSLQFDATIPDI